MRLLQGASWLIDVVAGNRCVLELSKTAKVAYPRNGLDCGDPRLRVQSSIVSADVKCRSSTENEPKTRHEWVPARGC